MGLISTLWRNSIFYSTYKYIKVKRAFEKNIKDYGDAFYGQTFYSVVKKYLNVSLEKDWIGRLYGVVNPHIDVNGRFDPSSMIIEVDGDDTNDNEYVKMWLYRQLNLVGAVFGMSEMHDTITVDLKHVGPEEDDNFLIVFDWVLRPELRKWRRKTIINILITTIIVLVTLLILL